MWLSLAEPTSRLGRVRKLTYVLGFVLVMGGIALSAMSCGVQAKKTPVGVQTEGLSQTVSSLTGDTQQNHLSTSLETFNAFLDRS